MDNRAVRFGSWVLGLGIKDIIPKPKTEDRLPFSTYPPKRYPSFRAAQAGQFRQRLLQSRPGRLAGGPRNHHEIDPCGDFLPTMAKCLGGTAVSSGFVRPPAPPCAKPIVPAGFAAGRCGPRKPVARRPRPHTAADTPAGNRPAGESVVRPQTVGAARPSYQWSPERGSGDVAGRFRRSSAVRRYSRSLGNVIWISATSPGRGARTATPWPRMRSLVPLEVPGGTRSATVPLGVGTSIFAPSTASARVTGTRTCRFFPSRRKYGCGATWTVTNRSPGVPPRGPGSPWPRRRISSHLRCPAGSSPRSSRRPTAVEDAAQVLRR